MLYKAPLFAALIVISLSAGAANSASGFSTDDKINLSNSPGPKSGKDIVASGGDVYATWFERDTGEIMIKKITRNEVADIAAPESGSNPRLAADGKRVFLFYDGTDGKTHFKVINAGRHFGDEAAMGVTAGASIAIQDGIMYAVYPVGEGKMQFAKSTDVGRTFRNVTVIEDSDIEVHYPDVKYSGGQRILVDGKNVYLLWVEGAYPPSICDCPYLYRYQHVLFAKSGDGGATFGPTVILSQGIGGYFGDPQISAYRNHVYAVWHVERGLPYFTLNTYTAVSDDRGDSFSVIREAEGNQSFDSDVAASRTGAYLVLANYTSGNTEILARDKNGIEFEKAATAGTANWTNDPQIAVERRHVYVLWEEGDDGSGYANDVFFRSYKLRDLG
ncbi:MAG: hypothetical protein QXJ74_01345 [Nitrososphaera sp.]